MKNCCLRVTEGCHHATLVELSESELFAHELRRVERPVKPETVVGEGAEG